jgi:hypothetical protein
MLFWLSVFRCRIERACADMGEQTFDTPKLSIDRRHFVDNNSASTRAQKCSFTFLEQDTLSGFRETSPVPLQSFTILSSHKSWH